LSNWKESRQVFTQYANNSSQSHKINDYEHWLGHNTCVFIFKQKLGRLVYINNASYFLILTYAYTTFYKVLPVQGFTSWASTFLFDI